MKKLVPVSLLALLFAACSKDEDAKVAAPTITGVEIGSGNNKIAYAGSDLHMEAQIEALGNIANVQLSIHPEGATGWEFDSVYTAGFQGLKNAEFHKHIDVPSEAATGHYHLHFTVTDQAGQKTEIEEEIEIQADLTLPSISGYKVELSADGTDLHVEGDISSPNKIARVDVEIHGSWETEVSYTDAAMVGQTSYHLHKHVNVAAAPKGHYHVHLLVVDQAGKQKEFEEHFDKN